MIGLLRTFHVLSVALWFGSVAFFTIAGVLIFGAFERESLKEKREGWFPVAAEYAGDAAEERPARAVAQGAGVAGGRRRGERDFPRLLRLAGRVRVAGGVDGAGIVDRAGRRAERGAGRGLCAGAGGGPGRMVAGAARPRAASFSEREDRRGCWRPRRRARIRSRRCGQGARSSGAGTGSAWR